MGKRNRKRSARSDSRRAGFTRAIERALKLAHPLQDCLYLALAEHERAVLVTADPKFQARARRAYASVELLAGVG